MKGPMYESKISDAMCIACDIPGNVGWIAFLAGLTLCFLKKPGMMANKATTVLLLAGLLCGLVMLIGVVELISERISRLDRVLPKHRLYRGFGALTAGGLAGLLFSLLAFIIAVLNDLEEIIYLYLLCGGSLLCFVFAGLILRTYKRV